MKNLIDLNEVNKKTFLSWSSGQTKRCILLRTLAEFRFIFVCVSGYVCVGGGGGGLAAAAMNVGAQFIFGRAESSYYRGPG